MKSTFSWLLFTLAAITIAMVGPVTAGDHYASPTGNAEARGTRKDPWDLATALGNTVTVGAGDTVWLQEGTYRQADRTAGGQGFTIALSGAPGRAITIRNEPGKHVTIDGGLVTSTDPGPKHIRVRGLEILVSENLGDTERTSVTPGSHPDRGRPRGGVTLKSGHDLKIINCVIRSNDLGIGFWRNVSGESEIYGNIVFDNGWIGPDRRHGHGLYTQNGSGDYKIVRDNLFIDNYGRCIQAYGSSKTKVEKYKISGNSFLSSSHVSNVLFGGTNVLCGNRDAEFRDNLYYKTTLRIGYNCAAEDVSIINPTFIRGGWQPHPDSKNITTENITLWRNETDRKTPIPADIARLQKNKYDPDRANLTLIQPTRNAETMSVDLTGFLNSGDRFEIRSARDFFGKPVLEGTFKGNAATAVPVKGAEASSFVILAMGE